MYCHTSVFLYRFLLLIKRKLVEKCRARINRLLIDRSTGFFSVEHKELSCDVHRVNIIVKREGQ